MEWLKRNYQEKPEHPFLNNLTYSEVYNKVIDLAGRIISIVSGVERVAICTDNSTESAIFIITLLLLKKEILLLNNRLTEKETLQQLEKLNIKYVFSSENGHILFGEVWKRQKNNIELSWDIDPNKIAIIMNTSATAGKFKAVPLRWKQIVAHVKASQGRLGVNREDNWLIVLPLFHVSGLSILFRSLYNGTSVTIVPKYEETEVFNLISSGKVNMISLVPTILNQIVDKIEDSSLRVILLGGAFAPESLMKKCIKRNLPVYKTYGMTETMSQSTTFCIRDYPQKLDSVGRPLEGVKISIKNTDKKGVGEICLESPMLMEGYIGEDRLLEPFCTGDIGYIDAEGFLYILNRRTDIIISGGENIYPKEIENILYMLSGIRECVVVGQEDKVWGQVPILYVVSDIKEEEIIKYLSQNLAKYKLPAAIVYVEDLPKNQAGKIVRKNFKGV